MKKKKSKRLQQTRESTAVEFQECQTTNSAWPGRGFNWNNCTFRPLPGIYSRLAPVEFFSFHLRGNSDPRERRNQTNIRGKEGEKVSFVSFLGWDSALAPHMEDWKRGEDVVIGRSENVQRTHPSGRQHWTLKPTRNLKPPAGILHPVTSIFTFMGYIFLLGTHLSGVTIMTTNYGVWEDYCALTLCGQKEQAHPERGKKVEIAIFILKVLNIGGRLSVL